MRRTIDTNCSGQTPPRPGDRVVGYSTPLPIVFTKAGTYRADNGKEKVAFHQGTVYFRHGAKSEPGDSDDLAEMVNREVERLRKEWLSNIKKALKHRPDQSLKSTQLGRDSPAPVVKEVSVKDPGFGS
jgi:hypothetical protein